MEGIPELGPRCAPGKLLRLHARFPTRARAHRTLYRMVEDAPGKLVAGRAGALARNGGEADLLAAEHGLLEFSRAACYGEGAVELLEILIEHELVVPGLAVALDLPAPLAGREPGNDPVEDLAFLPDADLLAGRGHFQLEVGRPFAHAVVVGHDARAGLEGG